MKTRKKKLTSLDYEYNDALKIPPTFGVGLKWVGDNGEKWSSELSKSDLIRGKRVARLIQSSYIGVSPGAEHYYGRIEASQVHGVIMREKGFHGGYMGKKAPQLDRISINVTRRLSKVEKDWCGDVIGKIGERTYRFNREGDVLPSALKLFKRKFDSGWILIDYNDCEKILCET